MIHDPFQHIHLQYAEEAALLWMHRAKAVSSYRYDKQGLMALDARIDAQLSALALCTQSWNLSIQQLQLHEGCGEWFVLCNQYLTLSIMGKAPESCEQFWERYFQNQTAHRQDHPCSDHSSSFISHPINHLAETTIAQEREKEAAIIGACARFPWSDIRHLIQCLNESPLLERQLLGARLSANCLWLSHSRAETNSRENWINFCQLYARPAMISEILNTANANKDIRTIQSVLSWLGRYPVNGQVELINLLERYRAHENDDVSVLALLALAKIAPQQVQQHLYQAAIKVGPYQKQVLQQYCIQACFTQQASKEAQQRLHSINPSQQLLTIMLLKEISDQDKALWLQMIGWLGSATLVCELFPYFSDSLYAALSANSFSMITGLDLQDYSEVQRLQDFVELHSHKSKRGDTDSSQQERLYNSEGQMSFINPASTDFQLLKQKQQDDIEDTTHEATDDLRWPNASAIQLWWEVNAETFERDKVYLQGQEKVQEGLESVFNTASQPYRQYAGEILAYINPQQVYDIAWPEIVSDKSSVDTTRPDNTVREIS